MNVERSLQIIAAATACMGTAMLGIGEENYLLVLLAIVVSLGSLILCDLKKWFRLNNTGSNIAALLMLALAVVQLRSTSFEQRILVMADLLGYLQFVLQFRVKTTRNYWLLLLVSFLQTCVAAALHTGVVFGIMLTMYLFCGVFFLGYFYLFREQQKFDAETERSKRLIESRSSGFISKPTSKPPSDSLRGEFSQRMTGIVFGTIGLSVFFFCAVPRAGQSNWSPGSIVGERTVGFTPEINLTRNGSIAEDPEEVMQVRFQDAKTNLPYQINGELYLRGTSLGRYARGRWEQGAQGRTIKTDVPTFRPDVTVPERIRQTVTIEPLSTETLFAAAPGLGLASGDSTRAVKYNEVIGQLFRSEEKRTKRFQYELMAPGIAEHKQLTLTPAPHDISKYYDAYRELLQMPRRPGVDESFPGLKATAASIVADLPPERVYERAKRLEGYLRDSGRFLYSLEPPERPSGVDPLEDFVTTRPVGHCEFFAGALTMMLRSVGIRSRIVIGYRGGEYNVVGDFYQFQQLHAHSWVEAYIPPEGVPPGRIVGERANRDASNFGAWLQLDGTPTASIIQSTASNSRWFEIIQMTDYLRFLWGNYVVGMDSMRQHESIYQPVIDSLSELWLGLTSKSAWAERWERAVSYLHRTDPESNGGQRDTIFTLIAIGLVVCTCVALWKRRRRTKAIFATSQAAKTSAAQVPEIEFYRRLETVLNGFDFKRLGNQTQHEFAVAAGSRLAGIPQSAGIMALPQVIVDAFYRVRFGKQQLDAAEQAKVEQALTELDVALAARRQAR